MLLLIDVTFGTVFLIVSIHFGVLKMDLWFLICGVANAIALHLKMSTKEINERQKFQNLQ